MLPVHQHYFRHCPFNKTIILNTTVALLWSLISILRNSCPDLNHVCLWDLRFNWFIKLAHSQFKLVLGMCLNSLSVTLTLVTASHVTSSSMSVCQSHNPCFKMLTVTRIICNTAWITLADVLCVTTLQFLLLLSTRTLFRLV